MCLKNEWRQVLASGDDRRGRGTFLHHHVFSFVPVCPGWCDLFAGQQACNIGCSCTCTNIANCNPHHHQHHHHQHQHQQHHHQQQQQQHHHRPLATTTVLLQPVEHIKDTMVSVPEFQYARGTGTSLTMRGSDELLSQSGAVSNGAAMSPQPHHAADNNNDAKK
ncbi:PREDICTED: protein deltex-like, partial [Habropoda laboriosa]|uniref:protein deltex-like n=1 Tax=Habropoda laboriosa TaxID=597456 RepID=UPI00083D1A40